MWDEWLGSASHSTWSADMSMKLQLSSADLYIAAHMHEGSMGPAPGCVTGTSHACQDGTERNWPLNVTNALVTGSMRRAGSAIELSQATCGARPSLEALAARAMLARLTKNVDIMNCRMSSLCDNARPLIASQNCGQTH